MRVLLVAVLLLSFGADALAKGREREGIVFGIGLGPGGLGGDIEERGRESGVALEARFGGMIHKRFALLAALHVVGTGADSPEQSILGVGTRFFVTEVFWLEAGLGAARYGRGAFSQTGGLAFIAAAGVDLLRTKAFALGIGLHTSGATYGDRGSTGTSGLTVLLTWY